MQTLIIPPTDKENIEKAAEAIRTGEVVSIPTETVYGLGANAFMPEAVKKIFEIKGRPSDNPLIVHISDISEAEKIGRELPSLFYELAEKFWPGPLSIIVKKNENIPLVVSAGLDTVAIRMPALDMTRDFIRMAGCPIAAPSANISGTVSATNARFVYDDFNGKIPYILDGGDCNIGIESTVVNITGDKIVILRPGGITLEDFKDAGFEACYHPSVLKTEEVENPASPGMKYKHYSPKCPVTLVCGGYGICEDYILRNAKEKDLVLAFSEQTELLKLENSECLSSVKEPYIAAAKIFSAFREADKKGYERIYLSSLPEKGMGISYMNRVRKSAGGNIVNLNKIIFVCTGNTCRSPIAEYLMKTAAPALDISSRGLSAVPGSKMSFLSESILSKYGIETKDFKSAPLTLKEAEEADIIYTMTNDHKEAILSACPELESRVFTLKTDGDIRDPYMGDEFVYEQTFNEILREIGRIAAND